MNTTVKGLLSSNEYEVDIIGKKLSEKGQSYNQYGRFFIIATLAAIFLEVFLDVVIIADNALYILGGVCLVGFIFLQLAKENEYEHTWVECKNHQKQIDKKLFLLLNANVKDYHNSKDGKFEFKHKILARKSGFTKNAIPFAKEYNIISYDKKNGKIIETDLKTI